MAHLSGAKHPMKAFRISMLVLCILAAVSGRSSYAAVTWPFFQSEWQEPSSLPQRFRNHCRFDVAHGRSFCSNHCGSDYQFYYCTNKSFGCCHIGRGYCAGGGVLSCRP
jgi:hypothetical protein